MKKEQILELFGKFEAAAAQINGVECWSARALSELFGHVDWRNFLNVVEKAREACTISGELAENHFVDVTRMVKIGSGTEREVDDIHHNFKIHAMGKEQILKLFGKFEGASLTGGGHAQAWL